MRTWFQKSEVVAPRGMVMEDQEIADAVIFAIDQRLNMSRSAASIRRSGNSSISRVTACCTRWMLVDSSGSRKPLARPIATTLRSQLLVAPSGAKAQHARVGERFAFDRAQDRAARFVVGQMLARIDIAVADAVLERDAPAPARGHRGGAGIGLDRAFGRGAGQGGGAVARQPVRPVLPRRLRASRRSAARESPSNRRTGRPRSRRRDRCAARRHRRLRRRARRRRPCPRCAARHAPRQSARSIGAMRVASN